MTMNKSLAAMLVLALSAGAASVSAAPVTRQFEFSSTSGALQFGPTIGSFTYDDSVAPAGGGAVNAAGLFSDLQVSFGSFSFDENTANSGYLDFDATGGLLEAHFGTNCSASGSCGIAGGSPGWWIRVGVAGRVNDFAYSGFNGEQGIGQTFANRLLPLSTVPEPGSLLLAGVALAGLGLARRRC